MCYEAAVGGVCKIMSLIVGKISGKIQYHISLSQFSIATANNYCKKSVSFSENKSTINSVKFSEVVSIAKVGSV
jgi:hypothetical protein